MSRWGPSAPIFASALPPSLHPPDLPHLGLDDQQPGTPHHIYPSDSSQADLPTINADFLTAPIAASAPLTYSAANASLESTPHTEWARTRNHCKEGQGKENNCTSDGAGTPGLDSTSLCDVMASLADRIGGGGAENLDKYQGPGRPVAVEQRRWGSYHGTEPASPPAPKISSSDCDWGSPSRHQKNHISRSCFRK